MADEYDRPRFDVYGTLLVLSFLMTLGAVLILNSDLSSNYGFQLFGDKPADAKWHNTQYRDLSKKYDTNAPYVEVRKEDLDEWKRINGKAEFPIKKENYEWPSDYRVDQYPVDPRVDNIWKKANDPAAGGEKLKEQLDKLLSAAPPPDETKKPEEKKPDEAKPPETPKAPEAPKDAKPPEK